MMVLVCLWYFKIPVISRVLKDKGKCKRVWGGAGITKWMKPYWKSEWLEKWDIIVLEQNYVKQSEPVEWNNYHQEEVITQYKEPISYVIFCFVPELSRKQTKKKKNWKVKKKQSEKEKSVLNLALIKFD